MNLRLGSGALERGWISSSLENQSASGSNGLTYNCHLSDTCSKHLWQLTCSMFMTMMTLSKSLRSALHCLNDLHHARRRLTSQPPSMSQYLTDLLKLSSTCIVCCLHSLQLCMCKKFLTSTCGNLPCRMRLMSSISSLLRVICSSLYSSYIVLHLSLSLTLFSS